MPDEEDTRSIEVFEVPWTTGGDDGEPSEGVGDA